MTTLPPDTHDLLSVAARRRNISAATIRARLNETRDLSKPGIPGAYRSGCHWLIPRKWRYVARKAGAPKNNQNWKGKKGRYMSREANDF